MRRLLLAVLLLASVLPAQAAWRTIYRDSRMALQVDEATLETRGMVAKLWVRQTYVRPEVATPGDFYFKSMTQLQQYACDKRTVAPQLTIYYDLGDVEMRRLSAEEQGTPVVPGSLAERTFNIGCKINVPVSAPPAEGTTPAKPAAKPTTKTPAKPGAKTAEAPASVVAPPPPPVVAQGNTGQSEDAQLRGIVRNLLDDNAAWMKTHGADFYRPVMDGQYPRATVVTCSDSQIQSPALDGTPEGDLYVVRNLGNQWSTNAGSIDYGVHKLRTPLLIFVGHTACSAVKMAMGDFSNEARPLRRELESLRLDKKLDQVQNAVLNVHNQIKAAGDIYAVDVKLKKLTILGAMFDPRNDMGQGYGKLIIVDVNGEADPKKVAAWLDNNAGKPAAKTPAKPAAKPAKKPAAAKPASAKKT